MLPHSVFDGIDVVVHLAGSNIAEKRWSVEVKRDIEQSRVNSTTLLAETIAKLPQQPELVITASGAGFYGNTGSSEVDESAPAGTGFLADVCRNWEGALAALNGSRTRVVTLRLGTVLNAQGGALRKMLPAFSLGVGGVLGTGAHYMSWIAMEDLLGIVEHVMYTSSISGPVNAVSPRPCTNREFTKSLGRVVQRPTIFPVPAVVLRACFGEMADEALLASSRVVPRILLGSGYVFEYSDLESALMAACGR
jgi:uncharacterized protein (TIGR01777 family)